MNHKFLMCDPAFGWTCGFPLPILKQDLSSSERFEDYLTRHSTGDIPDPENPTRYFESTVSLEIFKESYRMFIPEKVRILMNLLSLDGHSVYVVGGAVRNTLLDLPVKDWDLCSSATPGEALGIFGSKGIKTYLTGIDHGTITVNFEDENFEITTFRKDVLSDGRHAQVEFSRDISDDISRRDLTINSLCVDSDGEIFDLTGHGLEDLFNKTIRFVGDPFIRIEEDTLRILRAIRFALEYEFDIEPNSRSAIRSYDGNILDNLSIERVISEISRFRLDSSKIDYLRDILIYLDWVFASDIQYKTGVPVEFSELPWFYFWLFVGVSPSWFERTPAISRNIKKMVHLTTVPCVTDDSWFFALRYGLEETKEIQKYLEIKEPNFNDQPFFQTLPKNLVPCPLTGQDLIERFNGITIGLILGIAQELWCQFRYSISDDVLKTLTEIEYRKRFGTQISIQRK